MSRPHICQKPGLTIVTLGSEFESITHTALAHFDEVLDLASTLEPPRMVVHLGHTNYMDSAFLGVLFELQRRLTARPGGKFGVSNALPHCREVFATTKMDTLFDLFDTCEEAIHSYSFDCESSLSTH